MYVSKKNIDFEHFVCLSSWILNVAENKNEKQRETCIAKIISPQPVNGSFLKLSMSMHAQNLHEHKHS